MRSIRALLKRIPDSARDELAGELGRSGRMLLAAMQADAPVRTGRLRAALGMRLSIKQLYLRVGIIGKRKASDHFYGHILEFGRKAQTVRVDRERFTAKRVDGTYKGRGYYLMQVPAMRPRKFAFTPATTAIRRGLARRVKPMWGRILERASRGIASSPSLETAA
jgi:hypothetical protein